jgi:hypothetical protein
VAEDVRLTVGSVVRLVASYLGGYARVVLVENATRLVVDVTGIHVRVHASRTYSERTRDESGLRDELRIDVARAELVETGAPYPLAPAPTPTARPRRPRRPRAEALPPATAAELVTAPTAQEGTP